LKPVILITGASRGIGAATALLAASKGYTVAINYANNTQAAEKIVTQIRDQGGAALAIRANVADEGQVQAMFKKIDNELGPLSALVNNAGIVDFTARVDEISVARWQHMFNVTVLGTFLCSREAVRRMSTRHGGKGGAIVNVSSAAARLGAPGQYVDYASAKGAVDTFTVGLGKEVANEGIRVNSVRPGLIDTEIHASGGIPNRVRELEHLVPMQRGGTATEVAQGILWLVSDEASYVTTTILDVAGGR
jgi:NAD(P)-dependent dehydrogenase (short-subunit alcohol dehydrogenase family)